MPLWLARLPEVSTFCNVHNKRFYADLPSHFPENKGKMARMLAAKAALGLRQDAFSDLSVEGIDGEAIAIDDEERADLGIKARAKLENALRRMEGKPLLAKSVQVGPNGSINPNKFEVNPSRSYNADADAITEKTAKVSLIQEVEDTPMGDDDDSDDDSEDEAEKAKKAAKEAKKAKKEKRKSGVSEVAAETPKAASALSEADYERLAKDAGISVSKFKRKFERGDVKLNPDGTPMVLSKKDLKKQRKSEVMQTDSVDEDSSSKKKRKHDDEEETPKKSKKKSKKEKA